MGTTYHTDPQNLPHAIQQCYQMGFISNEQLLEMF